MTSRLGLTLTMVPIVTLTSWLSWSALSLARREFKLLLALRRARRSGFGEIAVGETVSLVGRVVAADTVASPHSSSEGVYLGYALDRWDRYTSTSALGGK